MRPNPPPRRRSPAAATVLCALLAASLVAPAAARAQSRQAGIVQQATRVLDDVTANNRKGLPPLILRKAQGVAIFPNLVKGAFLLGGRYGEGVILLRGPDGAWSYPIFVSLAGGSVGLQAGIQKTDLVLVFKNRQTIDSFFAGKGKLTLGVDGAVALGGMGRYGAVGSGVALKSQYQAFSQNRGLFAGVSVAGSSLKVEHDASSLFYGRPITPQQILVAGTSLPVPAPALDLQTLLMAKTGLVPTGPAVEPGEIVVDDDGPAVIGPGVRVEGAPPATGQVIIEDAPASRPAASSPRPAAVRPRPAAEPPLVLDPIPPDDPPPATAAPRRPAGTPPASPPAGNPDDDAGPPTRLELPPPADASPLPALDPSPASSASRPRSRPAGSAAPATATPAVGRLASAESEMVELPRFDQRRRDPGAIPYSDTVPDADAQRATASIVRYGRSGDVEQTPAARAIGTPALVPTRKVADQPPAAGRGGWRRPGAADAAAPPSQDAIGGFIAAPDSGVTRL